MTGAIENRSRRVPLRIVAITTTNAHRLQDKPQNPSRVRARRIRTGSMGVISSTRRSGERLNRTPPADHHDFGKDSIRPDHRVRSTPTASTWNKMRRSLADIVTRRLFEATCLCHVNRSSTSTIRSALRTYHHMLRRPNSCSRKQGCAARRSIRSSRPLHHFGQTVVGSVLCPNVRVKIFANMERHPDAASSGADARIPRGGRPRVLIPRGALIGYNLKRSRRPPSPTRLVVVTTATTHSSVAERDLAPHEGDA